MGNISYYAIKTIVLQKIKEFFFEFQYTIIAPLVSTLLFVLILSTISNYYSLSEKNYNYINFVVPGIIIMVVMQTSYQNISESLVFMKQIGSFNDYLFSPISRSEILLAFLISSIFIGLFVGLFNAFVLSFFVSFNYFNIYLITYYIILTSIVFSSIGAIVGFLSFTWDAQSTVFNFVVIPISLLSGTFFSIESFDDKWMFLFEYNPFYYLVMNFRKAFNENYIIYFYNEFFVLVFVLILFMFSLFIFNKGYRVIN